MSDKEKDYQHVVPDVDSFERSAARAWHSRMEEIDPGDEAVLKSMAGEVIAEPNRVYDIYQEATEIVAKKHDLFRT